jgi:hypothetical protein
MTSKSKRELLEAVRPCYLKTNKRVKVHILDEFCAATGYHRKYAIRLLKHGPPARKLKKTGRPKMYQGEVVTALTQIWEICGRICSRRLHPFLPEIIRVLERHQELILSAEVKQLLLQISRASIDRCLKPARFEHRQGLSTTKPGALLKKAIPVRTFTPWEDERPGFEEIEANFDLDRFAHSSFGADFPRDTRPEVKLTSSIALTKHELSRLHLRRKFGTHRRFPRIGSLCDRCCQSSLPNTWSGQLRRWAHHLRKSQYEAQHLAEARKFLDNVYRTHHANQTFLLYRSVPATRSSAIRLFYTRSP